MIEKLAHSFSKRIAADRIPRPVLPLLTAGILIGINETIFAISVSSLIFSGKLAPNLAQGIGIAGRDRHFLPWLQFHGRKSSRLRTGPSHALRRLGSG